MSWQSCCSSAGEASPSELQPGLGEEPCDSGWRDPTPADGPAELSGSDGSGEGTILNALLASYNDSESSLGQLLEELEELGEPETEDAEMAAFEQCFDNIAIEESRGESVISQVLRPVD